MQRRGFFKSLDEMIAKLGKEKTFQFAENGYGDKLYRNERSQNERRLLKRLKTMSEEELVSEAKRQRAAKLEKSA